MWRYTGHTWLTRYQIVFVFVWLFPNWCFLWEILETLNFSNLVKWKNKTKQKNIPWLNKHWDFLKIYLVFLLYLVVNVYTDKN